MLGHLEVEGVQRVHECLPHRFGERPGQDRLPGLADVQAAGPEHGHDACDNVGAALGAVAVLDEQPGFNYTVVVGDGYVLDTRQDWLNEVRSHTEDNMCGTDDMCGSPPFLMFMDAFPLSRFRMWQATPVGNSVCPRAGRFMFWPSNDLSQNGFVRYNLYANVFLCLVLALSVLGLLSSHLGGVRLAATRDKASPYERWKAIMMPMLILMVLLTVLGAFFLFVATNRITLALSTGVEGSFTQSFHFCMYVLAPLFLFSFVFASVLTARARSKQGEKNAKVSPE